MMEYKDFYRLASYANIAWRGFFTQEEIAENAYIYKVEWDALGKDSDIIKSMIEQLEDDASDEAQEFLDMMR